MSDRNTVFVDNFDRPTLNWRRGDVVFSQEPGPVILRTDEGELRNHLTLSGTAVHPDNFRDFTMVLSLGFEQEESGYVFLVFGKPHEWSRVEEAPLRVRLLPSGIFSVLDRAGRELAAGTLASKSQGWWTIEVGRYAERFLLRIGGKTLTVPWPGKTDQGGYFTIQGFDNTIRLSRFEFSSCQATPPLTEDGRRDDINAWKRWRMDENHKDLDRLESYIGRAVREGQWGYSTDLSVNPGLVRRGDRVEIVFKYLGKDPGMGKATIQEDYLGENAGPVRDLGLNWEKAGTEDYQARVEVVAGRPGNWRVIWTIGHEILSRIFAVIEPGYAVCTLFAGCNRPDLDQEIHRFGLPGDYWVDFDSPFGIPLSRTLDYLRNYARMRHEYGDRVVAFINAQWVIPGCPNTNLFQLSEELQTEGFDLTRRLWEALGVGPLSLIGSYTLGRSTIPAARRVGIKAINSLCQWQNYLDGNSDNHWKINHWAAPIAPYYAADDDFRKVGPEKSVVMFGMGTASSVRSYTIFSMEGCPTLCYPNCRYSQDAEVANIHRFYHAVESWLADTVNNTEPVFFTVGLENFLRKPDWARANAMGVEYLVKRARTAKLVFASAADIADFYLRTYDCQPAHIYYQPDTYCGYREAKKPLRLPDRIEYSDARMHSLHVEDDPVPQLLWDFTRPWFEPEWADQKELRGDLKLITPEQVRDGQCVPAAVNLMNVTAKIDWISRDNGVEIVVHLNTPQPLAFLPVALWKIPLDPKSIKSVEVSPAGQWKNLTDHTTGNLHGLLLCREIPAGRSECRICLTGLARSPQPSFFSLAQGKIHAKTFYVQNVPYTYLWRSEHTPPGILELVVPGDKEVRVLYNDRDHTEYPSSGKLSIHFKDDWKTQAPVLVGIPANELDPNSIFSVQHGGPGNG
jgi:hypothetical protein